VNRDRPGHPGHREAVVLGHAELLSRSKTEKNASTVKGMRIGILGRRWVGCDARIAPAGATGAHNPIDRRPRAA
jgi:hypothetical protein